jgi:hypothetical protein
MRKYEHVSNLFNLNVDRYVMLGLSNNGVDHMGYGYQSRDMENIVQ